MYPFVVQSGSADGGDARAIAILQQHQRLGLPLDPSVASRLSAQQSRGFRAEGGMIHQSITDATLSFLKLSHGLSPGQDRERILTSELLKHCVPNLGHQDQLAIVMALASRNQVLSQQQQRGQHHQDPQENLILKRAISQLTAIHTRTQSQSSHQALDSNLNRRGNNSVYCAEQDLSLEKDICFGRGQRVQRRKANVAFRKIVATYQETYDQAVSREDKKAVVKKVSRIFSRTGYRFFKESEEPARFGNGSKLWCSVSDHHVEYKIGHSFRSGRKQLKQQKTQRNEKEGSDADVSIDISNEVKPKKSQSNPIDANDRCDHSVYKEDELSYKCICIGNKREKYTGMEAYQYFREFILTFKSILGMTESLVEKTKIVSGLIEQIKTQKGYRFLKLMPLKKDVEFWIEASSEEISSEVFSIIGDLLEPNEKKAIPSADSDNQKEASADGKSQAEIDNKSLPSVIEETNLKRSSDTTEDANENAPKKLKRIVSDTASTLKEEKDRDVVSSSSSATNEKERGHPKFVWKKGRKRVLPEGVKKHGFVPSEIICKPSIDQMDGVDSKSAKSRNGIDLFSKVQREARSAISAQGIRIPRSLVSPDILLGRVTLGDHSPGALRSLEMLRGAQSLANKTSGEKPSTGNRLLTRGWPSRNTLEKALVAMRPSSIHCARERPIAENANLETANHIEMKGQLLKHLRQRELLYLEKKHNLAMLELQLQARSSEV